MSRSLVLGNGHLAVTLDRYSEVRDLYYPYVGTENHIGAAHRHRMGVFAFGRMSWFESGEWDIRVGYEPNTMIGLTRAFHRTWKIVVALTDAVYNENATFVREVDIRNETDQPVTCVFFYNQEFHISESPIGITAFYDPMSESLIHYKGPRVFLIHARHNAQAFEQYACGLRHFQQFEGTWKDAEDGRLSGNPIEHGYVDSTLGLSLRIGASAHETLHYWICVGTSLSQVRAMHKEVLEKSPVHILRTTKDFWRAWIQKSPVEVAYLSFEAHELLQKSLFVLRSHVGANGSVAASLDSKTGPYGKDTYVYVWPRDASFVVDALNRAGYPEVTRPYFQFIRGCLSEEGYVLHKYQADGSLGSSWEPWMRNGREQLPIQEDETALVLWVLWKYYEQVRDLDFIEELYNPFIKIIADFLLKYRDVKTGLPLPSFNLWESHRGVFTFTAATVFAGLNAASSFARLLGKRNAAVQYGEAATEIQKAISTNCWLPKDHLFVRGFVCGEDDACVIDKTIDASTFCALVKFGLFPADDARIRKFASRVKVELSGGNNSGRLLRFAGDDYFRIGETSPGNWWVITSLWYAQYLILTATSVKDVRRAGDIINDMVSAATPSGLLAEQYAHDGQALSVLPLAWSHAEYVITVLEYVNALKKFGVKPGRKG